MSAVSVAAPKRLVELTVDGESVRVTEGSMILDLVARLKEEGKVSIIMILHNYVHVLQACDRVSMIQEGTIALDKPTAQTSVEELTDIVVNEYRRARLAAHDGTAP